MGELARVLLCDASNVTQLAVRLEARGLVRRDPDVNDKRSRVVSITPGGREMAQQVGEAFTFPGERIDRLSTADQATLTRLRRC